MKWKKFKAEVLLVRYIFLRPNKLLVGISISISTDLIPFSNFGRSVSLYPTIAG